MHIFQFTELAELLKTGPATSVCSTRVTFPILLFRVTMGHMQAFAGISPTWF